MFTALIIIFILAACKKNNDKRYNFEIQNETSADVNAVDRIDGTKVEIKSGQSITIKTDHTIDNFDLSPALSNAKSYGFDQKAENRYAVYAYDYLLEYKISGTSTQAKIAFKDENGQIINLPNVSLPYSLGFKKFGNSFSISADNNTANGFITIEVFVKGKLVKQLSAPASAATSGIISN